MKIKQPKHIATIGAVGVWGLFDEIDCSLAYLLHNRLRLSEERFSMECHWAQLHLNNKNISVKLNVFH